MRGIFWYDYYGQVIMKVTDMHPLIIRNRTELLSLAERHGITDVRVFGSMARGDADENSDV